MEKYHEDPDHDYQEEPKLELKKECKRKREDDLLELYEKYCPNKEIPYYQFYNKFRDEFFESIRNDFSIVIIKYELDENFVFEFKNLLMHLACFCKSDQIKFFKIHFTKEQLEHMANYINCIGETVFHYTIMQIDDIKILKFLFTLTYYINEENCGGDTPLQKADNEYSRDYIMNCDWGKMYLKQLEKIPKDLKPRESVKKLSDFIGVTPFKKFIEDIKKD